MDRSLHHQKTPNSNSSLNKATNQSSSSLLRLDSIDSPNTSSKDNVKEQLAQLRSKLERAEAIQRGAENLWHQIGTGQVIKRKDQANLDHHSAQSANPIGGSSATGLSSTTLQASVEAELDLANRNVKSLLKEIEALEALSATSPRKSRRRLQASGTPHHPTLTSTSNIISGNSPSNSLSTHFNSAHDLLPDDKVQILAQIGNLIDQSLNEVLSFARIRKLSDLVKSHWNQVDLDYQKLIEIGMKGLSDSSSTTLRAESYRLLRYSHHSLTEIATLRSSHLEFFLIKSLTRDSKFQYEKLQALIFIRSISKYSQLLTVGIVRAIVSIAETPDEQLRQLSIETLGELMVRDFNLFAEADGVKVIMHSLTDTSGGLSELAPYMASLVMALVDRPLCRQYLKPGVDFEVALAPITEVNGPTSSQAQDERVRSSVKLIVFLLKSWTGLMFLCLNNKRSLRMYIQSMKVPLDSIRLILLDGLFEIFQIKTPTWFGTFMSGRRLTYYQKPGQLYQFSQAPPSGKDVAEKAPERASLVEHYLAILLLVFFDVKLLEILIEITESKGIKEEPLSMATKQRLPNSGSTKSSEVQKKASLLIAEILDLSNRVLPLNYGTRIQSLPRLFELAASFQRREHRSTGTAALREVDSLHRTKHRLASPFLSNRARSGSNSSYWDDVSLFRSFGIAPFTLSSAGAGGGNTNGASVNGLISGVTSVEGGSKSGGSGVIGSSASVSGLTSGLSLITGSSSASTNSVGGTGVLSVSGGVTGAASIGSEPPPNIRFLHHSDPRFRLHFINIDDLSFRTLLVETQVLVTKDHTRWNIDKLLELIEGTLYMNHKRLEELTRSTKVMKRLLGFLHPFEGKYPYIKRTKHTSRYTKLACSTLQTLLSDPVGVKFLSEDKLVEQIGQGLRQLDSHAGIQPTELLFSENRVEDTLTHGYFEMLGVLSKYPDGIKLMEKFKIFTSFYSLCEMRNRDDLVKEVIENVDYSANGHCRLVLSKALTSSYKHVRLFATHHLEKLISRMDFGVTNFSGSAVSGGCLNTSNGLNNAKKWLIRLLLTQLYDPSPEVCGLAVEILEEACASSIDLLETVVKMRPSLENLGDVGAPLLLRFLSTSVGARYLNEIQWTEREMDEWYQRRNRDYVIQLEMYLSKTLNADGTRDEDDEELIASSDGTPPPHFYGELVKTAEGRELLTSKRHFQDFVDTIQNHGLEENNLSAIAELKTALWAVGNIGASVGGLTFLESEGVVANIAEIAERSNVFSVRGTCYFVLGLVALTPEGTEILEDVGWAAVQTPLGMTTGICVPRRLDEFVVNPTWKPKRKRIPDLVRYAPFELALHRQILVSIANLSNHLLANNSSRTLARLKVKHREAFQDWALFYRAMKILSNYHYRLLTRRYVIDLFGDIRLDVATAQGIYRAGESMKLPRSDTCQTITNNSSKVLQGVEEVGSPFELEEEDEDGDDYEIPLQDLPLRSGSGLLEAYDKTDYFSDDDSDGVSGKIPINPHKVIGNNNYQGKDLRTQHQPIISIRGFLLS
ncbi:hypothetical protein O181_010435 [Austropuccinia psidii MF-1]|uniref:REM-1 domain-containing protein n=1 Tax=Austropuccinia psidii MF-1 TaxID=1389203 RepID=A0A9Q3BT75_9BASI|nr:hypothetical protein [Austropuccinia psidii MF-1]